MKQFIIFILTIIAQNSFSQSTLLKKVDKFVVVFDNNRPTDTILTSPGKLEDYKIITKDNIILILDVVGRDVYKNLKFDGRRWDQMESSCIITSQSIISTVPRNNEIRKFYTFKIVDVDKVEKFENNVSAGFVDFESIMKSKKEYKESMEKLWNERQSKNKN